MKMKIDGASWNNEGLVLETDSDSAREFLSEFKPGFYEITRKGKKRSLNANSYAWALIDKISEKSKRAPEDVYRDALREIGGIADVVMVKKIAKDRFIKEFTRDHIGRQCLEIGEYADNVQIRCIYGSSNFDTAQMARFIDLLVQEAAALEIYIDTGRIKSLLEDWDGKTR